MTTVIVTRPKSATPQTGQVYRKAGFAVHEAPCFDILTNVFVQPQWLSTPADVLVILSVHALHHALIVSPEWQPDEKTRVIGVGPAVVKAWQQKFKHPIESNPSKNSEGVIESLKESSPVAIMILTTVNGRSAIKKFCMENRISYIQINTYHRISLAINLVELGDIYKDVATEKVILTATSCAILVQFLSHLHPDLKLKVLQGALVVGSERIAEMANALGFKYIHVAHDPSDEAMCEEVLFVSKN